MVNGSEGMKVEREIVEDIDIHPCVHSENHIEVFKEEFHEYKMNHAGEYHITYMCNECECFWEKRIWMVPGTTRIYVVQEPTEGIE